VHRHKKNSPYGIRSLATFAIAMLYTVHAESTALFDIILSDPPLTLYPPPFQQAQANSDFTLNLDTYINLTKPEVDYLVTNNSSKTTFNNITLRDLPSGLIRVYAGANVCLQPFILAPRQTCRLRFYFDKAHYVHSSNGGPIVCASGNFNCYRPGPNAQIDDAAARAPDQTQINVIPEDQDGLHYDKTTSLIYGKPTRTGVLHFTISATNGKETTAPQELEISVSVNPHDKPVFKHDYTLASAMPGQHYQLNLMELIEATPGFAVTNQVSFYIDLNQPHPKGLDIDKTNSTLLNGTILASDAGQIKQLTIIARSNTGGDSSPKTIQIPVAFDPNQKPAIENGINLTGAAGASFHKDFRANIDSSNRDDSLKLLIDKIEPAAPWLSISPSNPTELNGVIPQEAVGQIYQVTVHANTTAGGNSEPVTIALKIDIDKSKTPRFYSAKPQLPIFNIGEEYRYDFVSFKDIYPDYSIIPYTVELAKGYDNPPWLRIENNQLVANNVPDDLDDNQPMLFIVITNIPGGASHVLPLSLYITH